MDSWCCPMKQEFAYKCTDFYHPGDEGGLLWSDPEIGVDWPIEPDMQLIISDKDRKWSGLRDTFKVLMKRRTLMNYVLSLMQRDYGKNGSLYGIWARLISEGNTLWALTLGLCGCSYSPCDPHLLVHLRNESMKSPPVPLKGHYVVWLVRAFVPWFFQ